MPSVLDTCDDLRSRHEHELRAGGYVPLTAAEAPWPRFHTLLPTCRVREVVQGRPHGRVVWSHPGRSGLDPRSVAALVLVRVADGVGADPLDEPLTLVEACRWLLEGDVEGWLHRRRHRVLLGENPCLYEVPGHSCLTHPQQDLLLQQVGEAFGDTSYDACAARATSGTTAEIEAGRRALVVLRGVGRRREAPHRPLVLPPPPGVDARDRGLHWYACWQLARHGQRSRLVRCRLCNAQDVHDPCRTCDDEGRTAPAGREWSAYSWLERLDPAFAVGPVGPPVRCGEQKCQGSLAPSAADEGVGR